MQIENEIVKEHFIKKLSTALDTSYESILAELEKLEKKENIPAVIADVRKDKMSRREVLEEYLLALIIQSEESKKLFETAFKILQDYKFAIPAFGKITDAFLSFFKTDENFNAKKFSKLLATELTKAFDLCFLYPLPKFSDTGKPEDEIKNAAGELRTLFIKDKIKRLSEDLKNKEKEEKAIEIGDLQKELSSLISLLSRA